MGRAGGWSVCGLVLLALSAGACGPGEDEPATEEAVESTAERTTELCEGITGMEALAWDVYNGVVVTDPVLPPPPPTGPVFGHQDLPLLGFTHPPGWTPTELRGQGVVGVNLLRDDQTALYRYVSAPATGPLTVEQVVDAEILSSRDFFGLQGEGQVVCRVRTTGEASPGSGVIADVNNVLVRIDGQSILLTATTITVSSDLPPSVFVRKLSSPTDEFPARLYDTFLAIDWQLLYGGGRNDNDRDGDGIWDVFDDFPDDPQRS